MVTKAIERSPCFWLVLITCCFTAGCILGPRQIDVGRLEYNRAIHRTEREEMLLNLVRLKYREPVEFVSVGSVAAQYSWDGNTSVNGNLVEAGSSVLGLGAGARRVESPTIAYVPRDSQEFSRALLSPLSIDTIALLMRTGWAADRIFRCTIQSANGINNAIPAGGPTPAYKPEFETFRYLSQLIRELQNQQGIELAQSDREELQVTPLEVDKLGESAALNALDRGYQFKQDSKGSWQLTKSVKFASLSFSPEALMSHEGQEVIRLLQLQPGLTTYEVELAKSGQIQAALKSAKRLATAGTLPAPGTVYGDRQTVTLSTRSLLEIMFFLSQGIQIPDEHLQQGMITLTVDESGRPFNWDELTGDLLRISVCDKQPKCAAVAVPYRGFWYYIHQSDMNSLSTFLLLMQLFNIEAEAGGGSGLPVLTLGI